MEHKDIPKDVLQVRIDQHMINRANRELTHPGDAFHIHQSAAYLEERTIEGPFTIEMIRAVKEATWLSDKSFQARVAYQVRRKWLHEQRHENPLAAFRTFFYYEHDRPQLYQVRGKVMRKCGYWNAGFQDNFVGEYDPPFLSPTVSQQLYHVGWRGGVFERKKDNMIFVHPADIEVSKEAQ